MAQNNDGKISALILEELNRNNANQKAQTRKRAAPQSPADKFIPEIPKVNLNFSVPAEIKTAVDRNKEIQHQIISRKLTRDQALLEGEKDLNRVLHVNEITRAQNGFIASMFDEPRLKSDEQNARQALDMQKATAAVEAKREELLLQDSQIDIDAYTNMLNMQTAAAGLSTAQSNAIMQSNSARESQQKFFQDNMPDEEIERRTKAKDFDDVFTPGFATRYANDKKRTQLDFKAQELAISQNQLDLSNDYQVRALENVPVQWAKSLLNNAELTGQAMIQIPGTGVSVSVDKLRNTVAAKVEKDDKNQLKIADSMNKMAKNNGNFSQMVSGVDTISALYSGGSPKTSLNGLNLLNVSDETLTDLDIGKVHPQLRASTATALQALANLNRKTKEGKNVSPQEIVNVNKLFADTNKQVAKLQEATIEATPKYAQGAIKEWFSNGGRILNGENASELVKANMTNNPDMQDFALSAAFHALQQNLVSVMTGESADLSDMDTEERTNYIMQKIFEQERKGKVPSQLDIAQALTTKNDNEDTPLSIYMKEKSGEIFLKAKLRLADRFPEYKTRIMNSMNLTKNQTFELFAGLSIEREQTDTEIEKNFLNNALAEEITSEINETSQIINSQLNPVRGSFMTVLFKGNPVAAINQHYQNVILPQAGKAWTVAQSNLQTIQKKSQGVYPNSESAKLFEQERKRLLGQ